MFKFTRNHLFSLGFVAVFAFNPGACARVGKGCGAASKVDDAARYSKIGTSEALVASREVAEAGFYRAKINQAALDGGMDVTKADELSNNTIIKTKTDQYIYDGQAYKNIESIPLPYKDGKSILSESPNYFEAIRFILHGSHLLHHSETYCEKSEKDFRLIILLPNDVLKVSELYACSIDTAQQLINMYAANEKYNNVIRAQTFKELTNHTKKLISKNIEAILLVPQDTSYRFPDRTTRLFAASRKADIPLSGDLFDLPSLFQSSLHASEATNWDLFFTLFAKEYTQALKERDGYSYIVNIRSSLNRERTYARVYGFKRN